MVSVVDCGQGAISLAGLPDATSGIGAVAGSRPSAVPAFCSSSDLGKAHL